MAQYDVYSGSRLGGYVIDIQSNLLEDLPTRLVAPLLPDTPSLKKAKRLHPVLHVGGKDYVMATHLITAVAKSELRNPHANLEDSYDDIMCAVYLIFQGF